MKVLFAFAFALTCFSCCAQKSVPQSHCLQTAKTQTELNVCANNEAKRVDGELNILYKKILAAIAGDALATSKVKAAERAWLLYRDAYVAAMYPLPATMENYGTIHPMEVSLLISGLTEDHIKDLKALLENYSPEK